MGSGLEQKRIHDAGHVAGNAPAAFGVGEMVGVCGRHGLALKASVASHAHKIGPVPEFQRCRVRGRIVSRLIMRVRVVASATTRLSFPEALRTLERLNNKCCLPKSPVFIKTFAGKVTKWNPEAIAEEPSGWQIIQFTGRASSTNRRLHVTLRANANEVTTAHIMEIHWRIERLLGLVVAHRPINKMLKRRPMAHFAIDARLAELQIVRLEATTLHIA